MTYSIDPTLEIPFNDRPRDDTKKDCRAQAEQLLNCLDLPGGKVKKVRIRKVAIDVEMEGDGCCC